MNSFIDRLRGGPEEPSVSFAERRTILAEAAAELDSSAAYEFEMAATRFAGACEDTIDFARDAMDQTELDEKTRFLVFTMGAIACRRKTDRLNARKLFDGAGNQFDDIPLFKHIQALSYDGGTLTEVSEGLELEREAYRQLRPHAGSAHAQASFIVQIVDQSEMDRDAERKLLEEGLNLVAEAIGRREYPKFHYTRGRLLRLLGNASEARAAIIKAIELEDRSTVDASDRLRDYRLELALLAVDQTIREAGESAEAAAEAAVKTAVESVEARIEETDSRLKDAQVPVVAAIGFVATAIGLMQITLNQAEKRPFIEAFGLVVAFGIVLFGTAYFALAQLRKK